MRVSAGGRKVDARIQNPLIRPSPRRGEGVKSRALAPRGSRSSLWAPGLAAGSQRKRPSKMLAARACPSCIALLQVLPSRAAIAASARERIGTHLEVHDLGRGALAAFEMERRPVAGV